MFTLPLCKVAQVDAAGATQPEQAGPVQAAPQPMAAPGAHMSMPLVNRPRTNQPKPPATPSATNAFTAKPAKSAGIREAYDTFKNNLMGTPGSATHKALGVLGTAQGALGVASLAPFALDTARWAYHKVTDPREPKPEQHFQSPLDPGYPKVANYDISSNIVGANLHGAPGSALNTGMNRLSLAHAVAAGAGFRPAIDASRAFDPSVWNQERDMKREQQLMALKHAELEAPRPSRLVSHINALPGTLRDVAAGASDELGRQLDVEMGKPKLVSFPLHPTTKGPTL